jgi:hypothetical protein
MIEGTPIQNERYEHLARGINQMYFEDTEALRDVEKTRRELAQYVIDKSEYEGWHSL